MAENKTLNRIKIVLEEKGVKQKWLAEQLGKSFCMINAYVCNRRQPSIETLFQIANLLNVNPKELLNSEKSNLKTQNEI
ncbi:MAG: helix-turn-helix transcriptional regulator [Muribaculaceae bacterium]|nr:helix-turn-helix transcriptional regulator [Muribaculaceae bacterium]